MAARERARKGKNKKRMAALSCLAEEEGVKREKGGFLMGFRPFQKRKKERIEEKIRERGW